MKLSNYLKSKTIQGIILLVILGILKVGKIEVFDASIMNSLIVLALGWMGIGLRNAIKPF